MAAPQASSRLEMLQGLEARGVSMDVETSWAAQELESTYSKLNDMARFQQKQLQEKEQKLLQLYDQQQQRAYQVVQRGSAGSNSSNQGSTISQHSVTRTSSTSHTTSTSQGGKVRQMFDERRQTTVKGIDRSYPLEPLENKPRKQANGNGVGTQKNGNLTVSRQSVTVKRVARADVNSNLNAGKPVVSYHEEITRESFGPSVHENEDEDEFGNENHVAQYANGNHRDDGRHEVRIGEMIDQDTIERNRMMAKLHLMDFDETMKHRVRNDLESEEFPEELMVDVPDRVPKRNLTKKLTQAEARLERFKNANAKRGNISKSTASTVTRKRSEPMFPSKSTSRESEVVKIRGRGVLDGRSGTREQSPRRSESRGTNRTSESFGGASSSPDFTDDVAKRRQGRPEFFSRESGRYAATAKIEPVSAGTRSSDSLRRFQRSSDSPEFFCKESEKSATTYSLKPKAVTKSFPSPGRDDGKSERKITKNLPLKSTRTIVENRVEGPKFYCRESKKSGTTMSIDAVDRRVKSPRPEKVIAKYRGNSPQFFCRETERSATTIMVTPETATKVSRGSSELDEGRKGRVASPRSTLERLREPVRLTSTIPGRNKSPEGTKERMRPRNSEARFFCRESEKSATTMEIDRKSTPSPTTVRKFSRIQQRSSPNNRSPVSLKDMEVRPARSGSPQFFCKESDKFATTMSIDAKSSRESSPRSQRIVDGRSSSPEFFCKESEKSATTMSLKPRPIKDTTDARSKSPRSLRQRVAKEFTIESNRIDDVQLKNRRSPKSSERSAFSGESKVTLRSKSPNILRSTGLVRDIMKSQSKHRISCASGPSRMHDVKDDKRHSIDSGKNERRRSTKDTEPRNRSKPKEEVEVFDVRKKGNKRPTTPIDRGYKLPTPELSPKSFTSTEVDTEIQEITMTDQFVEQEKISKIESRTISKSNVGKTYTRSTNQKTENVTTYSVAKCPRKRGSILKADIFEPMDISKKNQQPKNRRNSSESKSSKDGERTRTTKAGSVSLMQIMQNKSERHYSSSSSPTNESVSPVSRLRAKENVAAKREFPPSRKQTPSPTGPKDKETFGKPVETIFDESNQKRDRFEGSPPDRTSIFPTTKQRVEENSSRIEGEQILRSMELVQRAVKERKSKAETETRQSFQKETSEPSEIIGDVNSEETSGDRNRDARGVHGGPVEEPETVDSACSRKEEHEKINRSIRGNKGTIRPTENRTILKTAALPKKAEASKKDISPAGTCTRRHYAVDVGVDKTKCSSSSSTMDKTVKHKTLEQLKNVTNLKHSDLGKKTGHGRKALLKAPVPDTKKVKSVDSKASTAGQKDSTKLLEDLNIESTGTFDERRHKVVKKQEAIYSVLEEEEPEAVTAGSAENKKDGNASENFTSKDTFASNEISRLRSKIVHEDNEGKSSKDYGRTDSVESALRRFDSIGGESVHQDAPKIHSAPTAESSLEKAPDLRKELSGTELERGLRTTSTKVLDQKQMEEPRRTKDILAKSILKKTPIVDKVSTMQTTPSKTVAKISDARGMRLRKRIAGTKDSVENAGIGVKSGSPACKRRLFEDTSSSQKMESGRPKSKCSLSSITQKASTLSSSKLEASGEKKRASYSVKVCSKFLKISPNEKASRKNVGVSSKQIASKRSTDTSESEHSLSVKQLRSIEDIRKSIECESSSGFMSSGVKIGMVEESAPKSAIADKTLRCSSPVKLKKQPRSNVDDRFESKREMSPVNRSQNVSSESSSSPDTYSKTAMRFSRIAKSPSPDPVLRKVTDTSIRARRSVPSSPSKSPDTVARRPSTDLKVQDTKPSRRPMVTRTTETIGNRKMTTTRKSTDAVDGAVFENGVHSRDRAAETKYDNDSSPTKRNDAFVIEFDERPSRENDAPAIPKKPLLRKQSGEKQTQPGRPPSAVSSTSSSSTQSQTSKGRMATRTRTPLSGASPSKGSSAKSGGSMIATDNLVSCKVCGRRFAQDRVSLHEQICAKTVQKKRKQFDTMLYRVKGTDLEPFVKKGVAKKQTESKAKKPEVKSNWRRKHEDFINAIRSAKQVQAHLAAGGKLSDLPPPPASDTSDYIQCPHCGRKFNQAAAERHIPKCEHMLHNKPAHSRAPKPKR